PPSDRLAEDEDRQKRDEDRREEDEGIDLGERDGREGVGAEQAGRDAAQGAQDYALRVVHAEYVAPPLTARAQDENHDRLEESREKHDLGHGQLRPETLDEGIGAGKQRVGQESEGNARQHGITGGNATLAETGGLWWPREAAVGRMVDSCPSTSFERRPCKKAIKLLL